MIVADVVRLRAESLGPPGLAWLVELPALVAELEREWAVTTGDPLPSGTGSHVLAATTSDGHDVVLKLAVPDPMFGQQVATLAAAGGRGYVALLRHDIARHAVLLERLGTSLDRSGLTPETQIDILCDLLRVAWRAPNPAGLDAYDKAESLHRLLVRLWEPYGRPCSVRVVQRAMAYAERRSGAFDAARCVVVHGDAAPSNVLQVVRTRPGAVTGFVFVDPDGFVGDPEYDVGVSMRDWCPQLLAGDATAVARRYVRRASERAGVDEEAVWEWGFLERVTTGLFVNSLGAHELARQFLITAEALCERG